MRIIKGTVIRGEKIGKKLGYPTANLSRRVFGRRKMRNGVYAAEVLFGGTTYRALLVIGVPGVRRRFNKGKVEVYLLRFRGNLYGKKLMVRAYKKLRPIKSYADVTTLKRRIRLDIRQVRHYFK